MNVTPTKSVEQTTNGMLLSSIASFYFWENAARCCRQPLFLTQFFSRLIFPFSPPSTSPKQVFFWLIHLTRIHSSQPDVTDYLFLHTKHNAIILTEDQKWLIGAYGTSTLEKYVSYSQNWLVSPIFVAFLTKTDSRDLMPMAKHTGRMLQELIFARLIQRLLGDQLFTEPKDKGKVKRQSSLETHMSYSGTLGILNSLCSIAHLSVWKGRFYPRLNLQQAIDLNCRKMWRSYISQVFLWKNEI